MFHRRCSRVAIHVVLVTLVFCSPAHSQSSDMERLVAALLGDTPLTEDLRQLTDEVGGRPTGSKANLAAVEWGLRTFEAAGVKAHKEAFTMPALWLERSCEARVSGDVKFDARVAAMPFSAPTASDGVQAPLVFVGAGAEADFARVGAAAQGAFVLVERPLLLDIDGLFREYFENADTERFAFDAGVKGVVYMSSRPEGILFRHNSWLGKDNVHPILAMERGQALRVQRLLAAGKKLDLWVRTDLEIGGPFESYNVVAEIPGRKQPNEIVVIGAHLDSWGLGTGANDNGCNAAMMIDIARQMKRLGLQPARTIRFVLWNGEEQGMYGSWAYTRDHAKELDQHVMAGSIDIGSGRLTGFFTAGRPEIVGAVNKALKPVKGLGPFEQLDVPVVGTDNYDFMVQGVANIVGNQDSYNYGPNYHASSDNFDKVDLRQLRVNAAVVAAVVYFFAETEVTWTRQTRAQIQALIDGTDLGTQMNVFRMMSGWEDGSRGRK